MTPTIRKTLLLPLALIALLFASTALADNNGVMNPLPCPVVPYDGVTPMDVELLGDAEANTQCLRKRSNAKVVVAVNRAFFFNAFGQPQYNRATFFSNLDHLVRNYENVHGMTVGKDAEVIVVLSETGGVLATRQHAVFNTATGSPVNPFVHLVEEAMAKGIKIYLCQTAARGLGIKIPNMIPGIQFVPGGHIAVADFQLQGYALIQP